MCFANTNVLLTYLVTRELIYLLTYLHAYLLYTHAYILT